MKLCPVSIASKARESEKMPFIPFNQNKSLNWE